MKVLMSVSHLGLHTGGSVQMAQLARELKRRGHDITTLFKLPEDVDAELDESLLPLVEEGIQVERFRFRKLKYRDTILEMLRLRRFLKDQKFDVIHSFKGTDLDFLFISSIGLKIPVFITYRGMGTPLDFFNSFKYRSRRIHRIMAVSQDTKDIIVKSGRVNQDKIKVIYGGVNLDRFDPALDGGPVRDELHIPRDAQVVGIIGSIDFRPGKKKGGYEFARAARIVLERFPNTFFLCVGGINLHTFEALGKEMSLTDRFIFTGFRKDVYRMLAAMDISVCASLHSEGLMGTVRESLAMSVPVVSTDVGGNRELIIDGRTGFLVVPGDIESLASAIIKLLDNPTEASKMGNEGRKLVEDLCDFRKQADRVEKLYSDLLHAAQKR